jgi:hypothetical protein
MMEPPSLQAMCSPEQHRPTIVSGDVDHRSWSRTPIIALKSNEASGGGRGGARWCGGDQSEPLRLLTPSAALHE